ncbi:glycosyltransferase family 4 protein [Microlunatus lacustris]
MTGNQERTVVVATPSLEAYGADLQLSQSVAGAREAGWRVVVVTPAPGRLGARLADLGAELVEVDFPVLRRASASGAGVAALGLAVLVALPRLVSTLRRLRPDALYVNTVTLPWWSLAGRLARVPTLCHVHEAETGGSRLLRRALTLPLLLPQLVVVNSRTTGAAVLEVVPRLERRLRHVPNGVPAPPSPPAPPRWQQPLRMVVVGRLSPRKAPEVALEATAMLRACGYQVTLELVGTPVEGMEWFQDQLRARAQEPDLDGSVTLAGYLTPVWPALERADVVLAPSLGESFGNAVVEGQLARRPVVATALQGHLETVVGDESGLLVPPGDPVALAAAVTRLLEDPALARHLADRGQEAAAANFSVERYRGEIVAVLDEVASGAPLRR